jgi:hypothetical protein
MNIEFTLSSQELLFIALFLWLCCYRVVISIVSFDLDQEIYQIHWTRRVAVFIAWPFTFSQYVALFIGNVLGRAYNWSK